ncbi:MAG: D-Ala-D-Ala carboxypeptidase family metallohydrolase [Cyanobacteria bacterium J06628_6]
MKIKVFSDTLFKLAPKLSSQLSDSEKAFVGNGTELDVAAHERSSGGHYKVTLKSPLKGTKHKTWYVYSPDVRIYDTKVKLTVNRDTVFKLRPISSGRLPSKEKVSVPKGSEYYLQSYLPGNNEHVRIAIANAFLGPENRTSWYAYKPDVSITGDTITLTVTSDTLFKLAPKMSSQLPREQKVFIENKSEFELLGHEKSANNHIKLEFASPSVPSRSQTVWYAYSPDIRIEGNEPDNQPKNEVPAPAKPSGPYIRLPGFNSRFYLSQPILPGGNFTWAEATKNGSRIPVNRNTVYGIIRIAKVMEDVRKRLGNRPIKINSWYRDPTTNRRVGGASRSRHLVGDAVDFVLPGIHPYTVYDRLNGWWGSRGGLASATVFTHIDTRGYYARWSYGF